MTTPTTNPVIYFVTRETEEISLSSSSSSSSSLFSLLSQLSSSLQIISNTETISQHFSTQNSSSSHPLFIQAIILDQTIEHDSIRQLRDQFRTCFILYFDPNLSHCPARRLTLFDYGVNMVAYDLSSIHQVLSESVLFAGLNHGCISCPICRLPNLTEEELWYHMPSYHINAPNEKFSKKCPICGEMASRPLQCHIHDNHGPNSSMSHPKTPKFYGFSLVVCRHPETGKYLLCQEFCNQGFWVPGGAVDPGETFTTAAIRETLEEAGVDIEVKGILGLDHEPHPEYVRVRVVFYAEPKDCSQLPKSIPNYESAGACWCSVEEIQSGLRLRGGEPKQWSRLQFLFPPS
jgi:8-oxo-dGTP pyrophosphatase MutT (NUDIX family)